LSVSLLVISAEYKFYVGFRCPKTVENFCVHSRNGYYNGHVFHRVIKGFMIQTGDPLGSTVVYFLACFTAHTLIGYWHDSVVCPSVCNSVHCG